MHGKGREISWAEEMTRTALLLIFLLSNSVAFADGPEFAAAIGKQILGRCHMGSCSFFTIETAVPVGNAHDGTLYVISTKGWSAEYRDRPDGGDMYALPPLKSE